MTLRAVTIALALSGLVASARQSSVPTSRTLSPNAPVHQSLAGGERVTFTFAVPANTAAHVTVAQEGVDIRSVLRRTGSATPAHGLDFVAGSAGVEHLYPLVTAAPASWDVVISSSLPRAERGDYTVTLDLSPGDDRSRARAEARDLHYRTLAPNAVEDGTFISAQAAGYAAAASAALAAGDLEQAAESTFQTARRYDNLGDLAAAREWHTRALALFQQLGRPDREGRVLTRLGDVARKTGDVADAERYFRDALPRSREAGDEVMLADILNNSGLLLLSIGRYDEAIDQLQGALPTARAIGSADVEGAMTHNLAQAYGNLGDYDRAVEFFLKSIEVKKVLRLPRRIATSTLALADVYFNMGDRARAEETVASAVALFDQAGDRVGKADARGLQALMLHAAGDSARALEQFAQVVPELHAVQSRLGEARILEAWAEAEVDRGDAAAALPRAEEAVRLARLAASPSREARALYVRAKALRANRSADAIESIGAAIAIVESTRAGLQRTELRTSYLATVRRYFDLAIDLLHQQGRTAEAFEMSERARARTLLEGLAQSEARIEKGVDAQLTAKRRAVQSQINAKAAYRAQVAGQDGESSAAATSATREIGGLLRQLADVESAIRAASPSYWALQKAEPIDVARVQQQLLDPRTALVEYHVGHERSLAWVVDRESVTAHVLPGSEALDDLARRYHQALSGDPASLSVSARDKRAAEVAAVGGRLTAAVWTPIASRVRGKRVLIVADGALQYVPFAALPAAGGAPLISRHEIVYLPSASVLETMRRESRPVRATAVAVFADPVFSKSDPRLAAARDAAAPAQSRAADGGVYGRLRFSRSEAEAIAAILPGAFQALDFSAAKSTVLSRSLRDFRILHFATHGSLNTQHPQLSGLVLSLIDRSGKPVDGYLRLHEIYNLDLNADLVVLSACRTALGKEVHGEGLIGLTRGFMYAGASRVVSSVWNVDDRASAELMKRFYGAMLTKKLSPSAALRQAQLSLLADPRWANPHYWAAFGAYGEPN